MKKNLIMTIDHEGGIKYISLNNSDVAKTVSLSDKGCAFLDGLGADIILDFDKDGKLAGIELMGF